MVINEVKIGFNPLPSPKQGETDTANQGRPNQDVSIRSPHRSKGRPGLRLLQNRCQICFNPLPSPKQGETRKYLRSRVSTTSFNPLPSPKQGETLEGQRLLSLRPRVSIRSPHRSKGRRRMILPFDTGSLFQSAPLTEARGDFLSSDGSVGDLPVSIRSPHRSKGRLLW